MQRFSFYYRDSFNLKEAFPGAYGFSLLFPDENMVIEDGVMRLIHPEAFDPSRIHSIVRVYPHKYDYFKIEVSIRCWKDGEYRLTEITKWRWLKANPVFKFCRRVVNKLYPLPVNVLLFTEGNVSYYSKNRRLVRVEGDASAILGKLPRITDPVYYEFLPIGKEAFFRTAGRIYLSTGGIRQWELIYEGKRAIKNSMVWIEEEQALLFSEYTSGLDLCSHDLLKYYIHTGETKTVMTFHSPEEHEKDGASPYCRHIHVLMRDPFSNDIYLGVGDSDDESAIYRSSDNGNSFSLVGSGDQNWRTLSFIFTRNCIFWNTDSPDPQFLHCIKREQLNSQPVQTKDVTHWPLYNSASWNSAYDRDSGLVIMSASSEGALFDSRNRVYGIDVTEDVPVVYSLFEEKEYRRDPVWREYRLFFLGIGNDGRYWFYDTLYNYYRSFVLSRNLFV